MAQLGMHFAAIQLTRITVKNMIRITAFPVLPTNIPVIRAPIWPFHLLNPQTVGSVRPSSHDRTAYKLTGMLAALCIAVQIANRRGPPGRIRTKRDACILAFLPFYEKHAVVTAIVSPDGDVIRDARSGTNLLHKPCHFVWIRFVWYVGWDKGGF